MFVDSQLNEAINHYHRAVALKPDGAVVHVNLANALGFQIKVDDSIHHYREALLIDANLIEVHNNLGTALGGQRWRIESS